MVTYDTNKNKQNKMKSSFDLESFLLAIFLFKIVLSNSDIYFSTKKRRKLNEYFFLKCSFAVVIYCVKLCLLAAPVCILIWIGTDIIIVISN